MTSILRQMQQRHYDNYIDQFETTIDVNDFLMEILMVIEDLVRGKIYPADWNEMIMLQNWFVSYLNSNNTLFHFICSSIIMLLVIISLRIWQIYLFYDLVWKVSY